MFKLYNIVICNARTYSERCTFIENTHKYNSGETNANKMLSQKNLAKEKS